MRREVFEETGVEVRGEQLSGVYKNMPRGIVALVFRCSPISGRPTPSDETVSVHWLSLDEVREHMDPAYVVRITDAFADGAVTRVHDGVNLVCSSDQSGIAVARRQPSFRR